MELSVIDKRLAMDSRDIAELTHKQHSHVCRDIVNMFDRLQKSNQSKNGSSYYARNYQNVNGVTATYYVLPYDETMTLLTGYSVELRYAIVKRWQFLEKRHNTERAKSIEVRKSFTDELKNHGYSKPCEYIQTTKQMKLPLGIEHKKNNMTASELKKIYAAEALASVMIDGMNGYHAVNPLCVTASAIVQHAAKTAQLLTA